MSSTEVNRNEAGMTVLYFPILSLVFSLPALGSWYIKKKKKVQGLEGGSLQGDMNTKSVTVFVSVQFSKTIFECLQCAVHCIEISWVSLTVGTWNSEHLGIIPVCYMRMFLNSWTRLGVAILGMNLPRELSNVLCRKTGHLCSQALGPISH